MRLQTFTESRRVSFDSEAPRLRFVKRHILNPTTRGMMLSQYSYVAWVSARSDSALVYPNSSIVAVRADKPALPIVFNDGVLGGSFGSVCKKYERNKGYRYFYSTDFNGNASWNDGINVYPSPNEGGTNYYYELTTEPPRNATPAFGLNLFDSLGRVSLDTSAVYPPVYPSSELAALRARGRVLAAIETHPNVTSARLGDRSFYSGSYEMNFIAQVVAQTTSSVGFDGLVKTRWGISGVIRDVFNFYALGSPYRINEPPMTALAPRPSWAKPRDVFLVDVTDIEARLADGSLPNPHP